MPAPESEFAHKVLDAEMARFPELKTPYHSYTAKLEGRRTEHRRAEWHLADVVIAASSYIKKSFAVAGLDVAKVRVIPFGAPAVAPKDSAFKGCRPLTDPPVFLWAGTFGIRKGAHYLIDAWRRADFGRHARLKVYGTVALPERALKPLPDGIELCGTVSRSELMAQYVASDALIFPTLSDGFGMVVTEAWSCGLPVITTDGAGAADLLKPSRNGLLIPAGSSDSIIEALDWCLQHRTELRSMREGARETAARWQWQDYRLSLARTLREAELFGAAR
jgi:glycosyltransferase involved in cell wall biosynthesis